MDAVQKANSGHPGMPMGMADVATVLFTRFLKFDPSDPQWPDRDRLVLSAGHGTMLLYALPHLTGCAFMTPENLQSCRRLDPRRPRYAERGHSPRIDTAPVRLAQGRARTCEYGQRGTCGV